MSAAKLIETSIWPQEVEILIQHHDTLAQLSELDGEFDTAELLRDRSRHFRLMLTLLSWPSPARVI